ncbi:MAG: hypothetical protein EBR81_08940 [Proteobacteria bacterium]|nr:hypothetical protein [Pseudomonadota bacterium]
MTCRFCNPRYNEITECYASVLLTGSRTGLKQAVVDAEKDLVPCFTAYCDKCRNVYMLGTDLAHFKTVSEHHAHKIALLRSLQSGAALLK